MNVVQFDAEFSGSVQRKNPIDFGPRNGHFYPKKIISLVDEGVKKRGGRKKE